MGTVIRAIIAILVIVIAFKLLKGILGAKNLLSGGGTKRIK